MTATIAHVCWLVFQRLVFTYGLLLVRSLCRHANAGSYIFARSWSQVHNGETCCAIIRCLAGTPVHEKLAPADTTDAGRCSRSAWPLSPSSATGVAGTRGTCLDACRAELFRLHPSERAEPVRAHSNACTTKSTRTLVTHARSVQAQGRQKGKEEIFSVHGRARVTLER